MARPEGGTKLAALECHGKRPMPFPSSQRGSGRIMQAVISPPSHAPTGLCDPIHGSLDVALAIRSAGNERACASGATMHPEAGLRKRCEARRHRTLLARGFSLMELMVVMTMITIVAAATFTGLRGNTFDSAHKRFLDDVYGSLIQSRNRAIEDQTTVVFSIKSDEVSMLWEDPVTHTQSVWQTFSIARLYGSALVGHVCVYGLYDGVRAPDMPSPVQTSLSCLSGSQSLTFFPDGTFRSSATLSAGAGVTLVVADYRLADMPNLSLFELFPGGSVRRLDNVRITQ